MYSNEQFSHNIIQNTMIGQDTYLVIFSKDTNEKEEKYLIPSFLLHERLSNSNFISSNFIRDTLATILDNKGRYQFDEVNQKYFEYFKVNESIYSKFIGKKPRKIFEEYYYGYQIKQHENFALEMDEDTIRAATCYLVLNKCIVYISSISLYTIDIPPESENFNKEINTNGILKE